FGVCLPAGHHLPATAVRRRYHGHHDRDGGDRGRGDGARTAGRCGRVAVRLGVPAPALPAGTHPGARRGDHDRRVAVPVGSDGGGDPIGDACHDPGLPVVTPALETRSLGRRFGALRALSGVSVTVQPGTILGVIGPNGAGKSTLINLITGHLRPSAGTVLVDGVEVTGAAPWRIAHAGVARTFQIVKPFRGMTVRE